MIRILPSFAAAIAACTPSPQETAMPRSRQDSGTAFEARASSGDKTVPSRSNPAGRSAGTQDGAALGPVPEPVPAAENPVPAAPADSPAQAEGRRILSTAFVRVGPDGQLTAELRNGRVLVLRNVVMRRKDYCGEQVLGGRSGARYCGEYTEIAAARPGGPPPSAEPDLAAPRPIEPPRDPAGKD